MKFTVDAREFHEGLLAAIAAAKSSYGKSRKDAVMEAVPGYVLIRTDNGVIRYEHKVMASVTAEGSASLDMDGPKEATRGLRGQIDVELDGPQMKFFLSEEVNLEVKFPVRYVPYEIEMPAPPDGAHQWVDAAGIKNVLYIVERAISDSRGAWIKGKCALAHDGVDFAFFAGDEDMCDDYTLVPITTLNHASVNARILIYNGEVWIRTPSYTVFSTSYDAPAPADMLWDFSVKFSHDNVSKTALISKAQLLSLAWPMRYIGSLPEIGGRTVFAIRKQGGRLMFYLPSSRAGDASFDIEDHITDGKDFIVYVSSHIFAAIENCPGPMVNISSDSNQVFVSSPGDTTIHSMGTQTEVGFEAARESLNAKAEKQEAASSIPF